MAMSQTSSCSKANEEAAQPEPPTSDLGPVDVVSESESPLSDLEAIEAILGTEPAAPTSLGRIKETEAAEASSHTYPPISISPYQELDSEAMDAASLIEPQPFPPINLAMSEGATTSTVNHNNNNGSKLALARSLYHEQLSKPRRSSKLPSGALEIVESISSTEDEDEESEVPEESWLGRPQYRKDSRGGLHVWTGDMNGRRRLYEPVKQWRLRSNGRWGYGPVYEDKEEEVVEDEDERSQRLELCMVKDGRARVSKRKRGRRPGRLT
ncbi:hypothetical protein MMC28_006103 [Mycoblastus sanguinarius]|nr:hypothetical protein [Mycoblastus sanguinarius]